MINADAINLVFVFFCGVLVLLMQIGFAMLEAGLNSYKNTANILFKNLIDLCIGAIIFFLIGYQIMKPEFYEGLDFILGLPRDSKNPEKTVKLGIEWFYQMAFAATTATIVSGAVAGRMKFRAYLLYSGFLAGIVYPVAGRLLWAEQGLFANKFHDLAGSVVVHGVGGITALAAIIVLRPRQGRFSIPGFIGHHNLAYALLGALLLWVGWYGFNAGSMAELVSPLSPQNLIDLEEGKLANLLTETNKANTDKIGEFSRIIINTTLGAAFGALSGMLVGLIPYKKFLNLKAAINGALGGLVAITANCNVIEPYSAVAIGLIAGFLVILGEMVLESLKLDDTVGAVPVHALCGIWGGLAVPIFGSSQYIEKLELSDSYGFGDQFFAILVVLGGVFITMLIFFKVLKGIGWLEVSIEDEKVGLDISEHNMETYNPRPGK